MAGSKVIRIDEAVWAELQRRARPLEDTPNSVLRRVFGLPGDKTESDSMDLRVSKLLALVQGYLGQTPQVYLGEQDCVFLSESQKAVAYIRSQKQRIKIAASKRAAERAGLSNWDHQSQRTVFGDPGVAWYASDGDEAAYRRVAGVLVALWKDGLSADTLATPSRARVPLETG